MNINQVKYFVSVFENHSFSVAARCHGVSVQAVSKAISDLEAELSLKLFERLNRGVSPTSSGRAFYLKARPALEAFHDLESFSIDKQRLEPETLRIALCSPELEQGEALTKNLASFISVKSHVKVDLSIIQPDKAQNSLEDGVYDGLITIGSYKHESVDCVVLGTLPTAIVVASNHPLAKNKTVTAAELANYPAGESPICDEFNDSVLTLYRKRGLVKNIKTVRTIAEDDVSFMADEHGFFFSAFVPMIYKDNPRTAMIPIDSKDQISVPICLVTLKGRKSSQCHEVENFLIQFTSMLSGK